ncbi:extracellular solute-binding protein [Tabrizicola sp.]|jgi:peptide/nickel transport system substrate-binding protein|uniref:extracellular solute-binding protein n=1 Tax=Tabrizicola sp. TaxID=2005166 RepID=UPI0025EAFC01|nr:extracellular solute-binding protein [Tabrizicola sp.]MBY0352078.1 extracellular solute-binding protein [Tabrizicola sp.]
MITQRRAGLRMVALAVGVFAFVGTATAETRHGIAMYGDPALPPDFVSLPQVNPDAPKGGTYRWGEAGSFDSFNPYVTKGRPASGISALTVETLMGRNYDEAFSLYGLLAESIDTDAARTYVEFTLRPEARFSDGSPVTVEDVMWSMETLGTQGNPRYAGAWKKIASMEKTGERSVRFTFNVEDRELPLILGLRPILKKAQWQGKDFAEATMEVPVGSGPYTLAASDLGVQVTYKRNPDWWGKDLPFNRGQWNFDTIRYDYYANPQAIFEAFKAGQVSAYREANVSKWVSSYDFPAVQSGDVIKAEIPHGRPSGIEGFVFNTRKAIFADWRVREALILAFNFEFINQTLNGGLLPRIPSYFGNSDLGMDPGKPARGRELELLAPFKAELLPGAIEGYALPVASGDQANRKNIRAAAKLLEEAGWTVGEDGVLKNAGGEPFSFEILLVTGQDELASTVEVYIEALKALGITATLNKIDDAQYKERTTAYDFDMTHYIRSLSLSPGNEQLLYWGAGGVTEPGTRNWMGVNSPAVEAMIAAMLKAPDRSEFIAATKALDRVLTSGRYVIPIWYSDVSRLAYAADLKYPEKLPLYGDWTGFLPDTWWQEAR